MKKRQLTAASYAMIGLGVIVCVYTLFATINDLRSARAATVAQSNVLRAVSTVTPGKVFLVPTATAEAHAGPTVTPVLMLDTYEVKLP